MTIFKDLGFFSPLDLVLYVNGNGLSDPLLGLSKYLDASNLSLLFWTLQNSCPQATATST